MQNYDNYHLVYVDKKLAQDDGKGEVNPVQNLIMEHNQKKNIKLSKKKNKIQKAYSIIIHTDQEFGYIENLYTIAESHCKINELILFVDSSDYFIGKQVLKLFNAAYKQRKYQLAYTNYLNQDDLIGNLTFMSKKKINRTIIMNTKVEAPLFAVPATILSQVIELYAQNKLENDRSDERIRLNLMFPIL